MLSILAQYLRSLIFLKTSNGFLPNSLYRADKLVDFLTPSRLLQNRVCKRSTSGSSNGCHYGPIFFKPEKNLEFFRLKNWPIDGYPGKLE